MEHKSNGLSNISVGYQHLSALKKYLEKQIIQLLLSNKSILKHFFNSLSSISVVSQHSSALKIAQNQKWYKSF